MIVGVCSEKGAPGVSTLATVLALAWPGERVLLEADPSGGDLLLRVHAPRGEYLAREPTTLTLATAVRGGARGAALPEFAQPTSLGIRVIPGPLNAEAWTPMSTLWASVVGVLGEWPGTVIVDLGRLQPGHPAMELAAAADVLLLVTSATVEGLFHARERARELDVLLGGRQARSPVGVVVRAEPKDSSAVREVSQVLANLVPVVGGFANDPTGVKVLLEGFDSAHLRRTALMRSGTDLVARIQRTWPETKLGTGAGTKATGSAQAGPARGRSPLRALRSPR